MNKPIKKRSYLWLILFVMSISIMTTTVLALNSQKDLTELIQRGKLVVMLPKIDYPPFFATGKDGKLTGFSLDLAKDIAKELGVKLVIKREAADFNGVVNMVNQGKADLAVSALSKTLPRAKKVFYTNTYITFDQTILINRVWLTKHGLYKVANNDPVIVLQNNPCTIATLTGSSYIGFIPKLFPKAKIKTYANFSLAFKSALQGEVDGVFGTDLDIRSFLERNPALALKFEPIAFKKARDLIAIIVPPDRLGLLHWLNQYLEIKNLHLTASDILKYATQHGF